MVKAHQTQKGHTQIERLGELNSSIAVHYLVRQLSQLMLGNRTANTKAIVVTIIIDSPSFQGTNFDDMAQT